LSFVFLSFSVYVQGLRALTVGRSICLSLFPGGIDAWGVPVFSSCNTWKNDMVSSPKKLRILYCIPWNTVYICLVPESVLTSSHIVILAKGRLHCHEIDSDDHYEEVYEMIWILYIHTFQSHPVSAPHTPFTIPRLSSLISLFENGEKAART